MLKVRPDCIGTIALPRRGVLPVMQAVAPLGVGRRQSARDESAAKACVFHYIRKK
jgi:hypothetical protein